MKFKFALLAATFLSLPAEASFTVRGGGDAVMCRPAPNSPFKGFHALDYLVTYDAAGTKLVPIRAMSQSFQRLLQLFKAKLPELAPNFETFSKNYLNRDPSRTHLWEPAAFGLKDLKDEDLIAALPENCTTGAARAQIVQAIVRQPSDFTGRPLSSPTYTYVPKVLDALERTNPLQLSFLVVHEWLWDFSTNVDRNRRLNRFFHSEDMERMSREQILVHLRGLGFNPPGGLDAIFFDESCPADPRGIAPLFPPKNGHGRLIPGFQVGIRAITCEAQGGAWKCAPPNMREGRDFEQRVFRGDQRGFEFLEGGALRVKTAVGGMFTHLECHVDLKTAKISCGTMIDRNGHSAIRVQYNETPPKFSGTMSRTCLRLKADHKLKGEGSIPFTTDSTTVIYRQFKNQ